MLTTDAPSTFTFPKGKTMSDSFHGRESAYWSSLADKLKYQDHLTQADLVAISNGTTGVYQYPSARYFNVASTPPSGSST